MPRETNIQIRRGTASDWASANPTLAQGEIAMETDTRKIKVGDGSTAWNTLQYVRFDGGNLDVEGATTTTTSAPTTTTSAPTTTTTAAGTVVAWVGGSGTENIGGNSYVLYNYGNNENTLNWEMVSPCTSNCCGADHSSFCREGFEGVAFDYSYDNSSWTFLGSMGTTGSNLTGGNYPPPAASPSGIVYFRVRAEEPAGIFGPYAYAKLT